MADAGAYAGLRRRGRVMTLCTASAFAAPGLYCSTFRYASGVGASEQVIPPSAPVFRHSHSYRPAGSLSQKLDCPILAD